MGIEDPSFYRTDDEIIEASLDWTNPGGMHGLGPVVAEKNEPVFLPPQARRKKQPGGRARAGPAELPGGRQESSPSVEAVLRYADRALYEAKQTGRNRVCVAKRPLETVAPAAA